MLDNVVVSLQAIRLLLQAFDDVRDVRLLTCDEYIKRIGGKLTVETLQDWIKNQRHGRFKNVVDFGKAGYRIPEYYVYYSDEQYQRLFPGSGALQPLGSDQGAPAAGTDTAGTNAEEGDASGDPSLDRGRTAKGASSRAGAPKRGAVQRHPAEALLEGVLDD